MSVLPQVLKNVKVAKKFHLDELPKVSEKIKKIEGGLGQTGRVLFRYSGTEDLARIMLEGENLSELEVYAEEIAVFFQRKFIKGNVLISLGVNIDHVATLRNARGETYPSPMQAAAMAEMGGADNITCHLREDRDTLKIRFISFKRNNKYPSKF